MSSSSFRHTGMPDECKPPSALLSAGRRSSTGALEYARSRSRRAVPSLAAHRANRASRHHRRDTGRRASDAAINNRRPPASTTRTDHHHTTNNSQLISVVTPKSKAHANLALDRVDFVAPLAGERQSTTRFSSSSESKLEVAKQIGAKVADDAHGADVAIPRRSSTGALEQALTTGVASQKLRKHRAHGRRDSRNRRASLADPPVQSISFRTTNKINATPPSVIRASSLSRTETNMSSLTLSHNIDGVDINDYAPREESQRLQQQEQEIASSNDSLTIDAVSTSKDHSISPHNIDNTAHQLNRSGLNSSATDGSASSFSWWATTFRRNSVSQLSDGVLVGNEVTAPSTFFQHLESISTTTKIINVDTSRMHTNNGTLMRHQVKGMIEALSIYESLASSIVDDKKRSVAFPLYFCLYQYVESRYIDANCRQSFMMHLANDFVRESEGRGFHLCVSLALQAEAFAQGSRYDKALASYVRLQSIYDIQLSPQICKIYGTDRAARCHSLAILWLVKAGDTNAALEQSKYVIDSLLPNMDQRNLPNLICVLCPLLAVLKNVEKASASRAKDLCEQYILDYYTKNVKSSLENQNLPLIVFKPLYVLLIIHADEFKHARWRSDLTSIMLWAADADNGRVSSDALASTMSSLGWCSDTLMAELCLRLSFFAKSEPLKQKLLIKCKRLTSAAKESMTDKHGNELYPIAFEENEKVIRNLNGIKGFKYCQEFDPESSSTLSQTNEIDIEHCIDKYLSARRHREREGGRRNSLVSMVSQKSSMSSVSGTRISEPRLVEARSRMA